MTLLRQCIKQHFPHQSFKTTTPNGGYTLFVSAIDKSIDESTLINALIQAGVKVTDGSQFYLKPKQQAQFRLSIAELNETDIERGICRIARVLTQFSR